MMARTFGLLEEVAAVWASTTRWANLMQHNLTAADAPSQVRRILDLMEVMASHVVVSWGLLIL